MTDKEKELIFLKSQERAERDKIRNSGVAIPFGNSEVTIKALGWDDSNAFEDEIVKATEKISDVTTSDLTKVRIDEVLNIIVQMLRNDLVKIAGIGTKGKVNIDFIREVEATKDDVIKLVIELFNMNYSYAKNLIALLRAK